MTIHPNRHVLLVGEPRAGRSTLVDALRRVLTPDLTRFPLTDDLDFNRRDRSKAIGIEVVLGGLGDALEQDFFDQLEPWNEADGEVVTDTQDPTDLDNSNQEFVVRLCYRAQWNDENELADHWVDFPKTSDPVNGQFSRVPRQLRELLPFVSVDTSSTPLGLGTRSAFRKLIDESEGDDFGAALEELLDKLETGSGAFSESNQLAAALESVVSTIRRPLGLGRRAASKVVRYLPEGGSLAGVLRSLGPSVSLSRSLSLPLRRHGSTTLELLRSAEALALAGEGDAVAVIDDFGEDLDASTAAHVASAYRSTFGQVWLSTRRGAAAEVFRPDELVRVVRPRRNEHRVHQGATPTSRADRVAARHLVVQLLPAVSSKTVAILEGPHDHAGLLAVAARQLEDNGVLLPAADGVTFVHAAAADGSGGAGNAVKLANFAAGLGFRVVVVLDGDQAGDDVEPEAAAVSYAVVRLPRGHAIERALTEGLSDTGLRTALNRLGAGFGAPIPSNAATATGDALVRIASDTIKTRGGLHAQFVELLPATLVPPIAARVLQAVRDASRGRASGVIAL